MTEAVLSLMVLMSALLALGFLQTARKNFQTTLIFRVMFFIALICTVLLASRIALESMTVDALHAALALLAFIFMSLAVVFSLFALVQEGLLRRHQQLPLVSRMPPLQLLETCTFQLVGLATGLITFLLAWSMLHFDNVFQQPLLYKLLMAVGVWFVLVSLILVRHLLGLRGKVAFIWVVVALLSVGLCSTALNWLGG